MAEILPFRRQRRWTRATDYGVPKRRRGKVDGRRRGRGGGWLRAARELGPILWAAPLALGVAVFLATSPVVTERSLAAAIPLELGGNRAGVDRERATFAKCGLFASRDACVIDGDTFWYRGEKIRIADINTPETSDPQCPAEAALGARATARLTELLNAGAFSLERTDRTPRPLRPRAVHGDAGRRERRGHARARGAGGGVAGERRGSGGGWRE